MSLYNDLNLFLIDYLVYKDINLIPISYANLTNKQVHQATNEDSQLKLQPILDDFKTNRI